jgi:hypothetical protein
VSHALPFGALAEPADLATRYLIGQAAMRSGNLALDAGRADVAASEFEVAAHAAGVPADAIAAVDSTLAAHWDLVATVRCDWAARAHAAAHTRR